MSSPEAPLEAELWLLNSCTVKGPSEDSLRNTVRRGRELGKKLVVAGCVPQGQRNHPDLLGLSVVGVSQDWHCSHTQGKHRRWTDVGLYTLLHLLFVGAAD